MIYVYVLKSIADQSRYTGMAKDVKKRLSEHNAGRSKYTKAHRPWKIIYIEVHETWAAARKREKYLKSAAGRKWLDKHLADSGQS